MSQLIVIILIVLTAFQSAEVFAQSKVQHSVDSIKVQRLEEALKDQGRVTVEQKKSLEELRSIVFTQNKAIRALNLNMNKIRTEANEQRRTSAELRKMVEKLKNMVLLQGKFNLCDETENRTPKMHRRHSRTNHKGKDQANRVQQSKSSINLRDKSNDTRLQANVGNVQQNLKCKEIKLDRGKCRRQVQSVPAEVAFSSYLSHDLHNLGIGSILIYDKTLLNDGNSYNTRNGVFTCRVSGVYLFSFSVTSYGKKVLARLTVDGANEFDIIAHPNMFNQIQDIMASNTVVVRILKGQNVWVEIYLDDGIGIRSDVNFRFATFSGVLLYADP